MNDEVWVVRPNVVHIFDENSLLDDSPALTHMREIMSIKSDYGKRASVSAVDIETGEFVEFN